MNYEDLINLLVESFKTGVPKNITADKLREALIKVVEFANVTRGDYQGTAIPSTNPGTPSTPVYYFAGQSGTYTNFGGIVVDATQGINILSYSGSAWSKAVVPVDLSGYTGVDEFESLEEKVGTVIIPTKNLLDKRILQSGSYSQSGNMLASNNWISTLIMRIPNGISEFVFSGYQGFSTEASLVVFFNEAGAFLGRILRTEPGSTGQVLTRSSFPAGATKWAFNIANQLNIGLNPTDNLYANQVMLRDSAFDGSYEPYGAKLDVSKLSGLPAGAAPLDRLIEVEGKTESLDLLMGSFEFISNFNGSTSSYKLPKKFILQNNGDYVEIVSRWGGSTFNQGLGLLGVNSDSVIANVFGYYNSSQIRLREIGSSLPWIVFGGLTGLAAFNKIRLEIISGKYNLFMNDELKGQADVTNGVEIEDIGNGYNTNHFLGAVKSFKIKSGAEELELNRFMGSGSVDITATVDIPTPDSGVRYPDFFYQFSPTAGTNSAGRFTAYTKRKGYENVYVGHFIEKHLDMSDAVYIDYWRNRGAFNFLFDGENMAQIGTQALLNVENEFTMLCPGKDDHTGGTHGDEMTVEASFMADGVKLNISSAIPLTPCKTLKYQVLSTLHETAATGGSPVPGHPIIADHIKTVTFGDGGWICRNMIKSRIAGLAVTRIYTGLICNHKDQATYGFTDVGGYTEITDGDNSTKLSNPAGCEFHGNNPVTGLSSYITSKCVFPRSKAEPAVFYINDRPTDSKYYRWIGPFTMALNDTVVVESKLECL